MSMAMELDRREIYRYLGYRPDSHTLTAPMEELVERGIVQVLETASPRVVSSQPLPLEQEADGLTAAGFYLEGRDISRHLEHCTQVVLLAVTLGAPLDAMIRRAEVTDMAWAVVLDAVSNVAVETAAQQTEETLRKQLEQEGRYLTGRYSPGYGDFPISVQHELLRLLDAGRKIGLSVTQSHIMTPRKSITAVMGIAEIPVKGHLAGCGSCVLRQTCLYRKRGTTCAISD